jgi:hypothetical protein
MNTLSILRINPPKFGGGLKFEPDAGIMMSELVLNQAERKEFFYNLNRFFSLSLPIFQHSIPTA